MRRSAKLAALLVILAASALVARPAQAAKKFYIGGGLGLGFGAVEFVDISGVFAYHVTPRLTTGVRLTWRSREDTRPEQSFTTNDYGAALFARYFVKRPFFVHAEYERLRWEYRVNLAGSTERALNNNFFVGGGVGHPLSPNVSLFVTVLYNLTYDSSELRRPYDSPWLVRAGVGFSF